MDQKKTNLQAPVPEEELRDKVLSILVFDKNYIAAVNYYASATGCSEGEARRFVDKQNGIVRAYDKKGNITINCPKCNAPLNFIGKGTCPSCGNPVEVSVPKPGLNVKKTTWWGRNGWWVYLLILLALVRAILSLYRISH